MGMEGVKASQFPAVEGATSSSSYLQLAEKTLSLAQPRVMGILNLTPDSFVDGGKYNTKECALKRVDQMQKEGADIIDLGAESSHPFAKHISLQEEIDRIMEILISIKQRFDLILSVDTYKPEVMKEAIAQGVHLINDIYALRMPGALEVVAQSQVGICLMHMQNSPDTMQLKPYYKDVVCEVSNFLQNRATVCAEANILQNRIIIDPGFGFGKTTEHNLLLLKHLTVLKDLGFPILAGLSRKASIGEILSLPAQDRLYGSIAAHSIAVVNGAAIVRTHDVKPTAEALKIAEAVLVQENFV